MSLEQQLRETMRRAADGVRPDAARAYDRFLRRRRRRVLLAPAVAAMVVALLVATTMAVAQRLPDPAEPVHPAPTPTPTPTPEGQSLPPLEYQSGPRTVEVPAGGYSIEVPDGWLVATLGDQPGRSASPQALRLRPESEPRAEIQIGTVALKPELGPGKGEAYPATTHFPTTGFHAPSGPHSYFRRPDGRRVLEAGGAATVASYYVAWPYHCLPDEECRPFTKLRTLSIRFYAPEAVWPEVRAVGEAIVRDAQPITNALPGGDQSVQPERCPVHPTGASLGAYNDRSDVTVQVEFDGAIVPCRFRAEVALELTENGQPAPVEGAGEPVVLEGTMPEDGADPDGHFLVAWRWTNWCGGRSVQLQIMVNGEPDPTGRYSFGQPVPPETTRPPGFPEPQAPDCIDPSRLSRLDVVATEP